MPVKIHPAAIDQMCRFFNMHKKGYPEWLKNAREVYLRLGVPQDRRFVIIHYRSARGGRPEELECIDFGGISGSKIDSDYMEWANPYAAGGPSKVSGIEGGQGNGGKAYLRQMFERGYFISIDSGKLSVVGFLDDAKYELGFVPDIAIGKDNLGENPLLPGFRKYAREWLGAFSLPNDHNITIVRGISPRKPVDIDSLVEEIQQHPQARQTIRTCKVSLFIDGSFKRDLVVKEPERDPAFPKAVEIPVPTQVDHNGIDIITCRPPAFPQGKLILGVSKTPLRGQALQTWNRIDFHGDSVRVIGYKQVPELELSHPEFAHHIFGECTVPLLSDPLENYESGGRGPLVDGPLSGALYSFIAQEVDKVLTQLAKRNAGAVATQKRKNLEILNEKLAEWIENKLSSLKGLEQTGDGVGSGKKKRKPPTEMQHNPPVKIFIHRPALTICENVQYQLRAYGKDTAGRPVPPGKLVWRSNNSAVATIHPETGRVTAKSSGLTLIVAENEVGLLTDPLVVSVIKASKIEVKSQSPAKLGSNRRLPLLVYVTTGTGQVEKDAIVAWRTSDINTVSVGQDGVLVGGEVGEAEVEAYAGVIESDPLEVIVEKGAGGKPKGGGHGRPSFLLSGQHKDPFDGSPDTRLQPTDPAVYQRPYKPDYENNVFWINLQHPLAEALLEQGENSIQWRTYHFQRIVDAYTTIELRSRFGDDQSLDVDRVLGEIHEIMASLYRDARDEIYGTLYTEDVDIATL
jgi:hypothetical protein